MARRRSWAPRLGQGASITGGRPGRPPSEALSRASKAGALAPTAGPPAPRRHQTRAPKAPLVRLLAAHPSRMPLILGTHKQRRSMIDMAGAGRRHAHHGAARKWRAPAGPGRRPIWAGPRGQVGGGGRTSAETLARARALCARALALGAGQSSGASRTQRVRKVLDEQIGAGAPLDHGPQWRSARRSAGYGNLLALWARANSRAAHGR